jgi:hypothetical protein
MKSLLEKAIDTYGEESQKIMAIEEMSELTKEICKDKRNLSCKLKIAEEIADVEIMLEQLKIIYKADKQVQGFKKSKLERLEQRLNTIK